MNPIMVMAELIRLDCFNMRIDRFNFWSAFMMLIAAGLTPALTPLDDHIDNGFALCINGRTKTGKPFHRLTCTLHRTSMGVLTLSYYHNEGGALRLVQGGPFTQQDLAEKLLKRVVETYKALI